MQEMITPDIQIRAVKSLGLDFLGTWRCKKCYPS